MVILRCLILVLLVPGQDLIAQQRAFTVDDLLREEAIAQVKLSPDGRWLAYVQVRSKSAAETYQKPFLFGKDRADIWLVATEGGSPRNLTQGISDGSGFWQPVWSPDGTRLALLSNRGGNVRLWLLNVATSRLQRLTDLAVDVLADPPMLWVSNEHLLCAALGEGEKPRYLSLLTQAQEVAARQWPEAVKGKRSTASVLESGQERWQPQGHLLRVNTKDGSVQKLSDGQVQYMRLSPDASQVAVARSLGRWPVSYAGALSLRIRSEIAVVTLEAHPTVSVLGRLDDIRAPYFRWRPDGRALIAIAKKAYQPAEVEPEDELFLIPSPTGAIQSLSQNRFLPHEVVVDPAGKLLMLAQPGNDRAERRKARRDWWLLDGVNSPRNLTSDLKRVPTALVTGADGTHFAGVADGDLWLLSTGGERPKKLTSTLEHKIRWIVWPAYGTPQRGQANRQVIVEARNEANGQGQNRYFYLLSLLNDQEPQPIPKPSETAVLADWSDKGAIAAITGETHDGTYLWGSKPLSANYRSVVRLNAYWEELARQKRQTFRYRSLKDEQLTGLLIYPHGYKEGQRYPLVVCVYPGMEEDFPLWDRHLYPLISRGYAVLVPSMPLYPGDNPSAPMSGMLNGVMPAIDKVVEMGVADPERLAVMGESYGGYATLSLITQTNRFKAAIAKSPGSNWISLYGSFAMFYRYSTFAHEDLSFFYEIEIGQVQMKAPPWTEPTRYIQNSPIFSADKVQTPVMIIQGDIDYVSIGQGEEFFMALYRQEKRARFVRYWGEGHSIDSPANIRDQWEQIFGWLDEHLKRR
jgi:dipeptidyl aminopeptidase/acylaminoacyl peptidase